MTDVREDCKYTKSHEWVRVEGDIATCGIAEFAQSSAGELVFVELPDVDVNVAAGDDVCVVESVKAASDVYTPLSGTIVEVNEVLVDEPSTVNDSCYDEGWLFKIKMSNITELDGLLSAEDYQSELDA